MTRTRNAKGQGARLRDDILEAGMVVLAEAADARQVTIRAVAAAAGVTPPSIYLYFPDRAALLRALVQRGFQMFDRVLDEAARGISDPRDALRRRSHAYIAFAAVHPGEYRVVFSAAGLGPEELEVPPGERHPGHPSFEALVAAVVPCVPPNSDPLFVAVQLWSFLHGLADLRLTKPELPWPAAEELIDATLVRLGVGQGGGAVGLLHP
ncbi:MAG: TetR/AcrR family transcriptional regulator [Chloroflexi bacterium]|nr:TetR/AcrR family transcriptional regulator [Chloroflexota bacterium]